MKETGIAAMPTMICLVEKSKLPGKYEVFEHYEANFFKPSTIWFEIVL